MNAKKIGNPLNTCPACAEPLQLWPNEAPSGPMEDTWMVYGSLKPEGGREGPYPLSVKHTRVVLPNGRACCDRECAEKSIEIAALPPEEQSVAVAEWRKSHTLHGLPEYGEDNHMLMWTEVESRFDDVATVVVERKRKQATS